MHQNSNFEKKLCYFLQIIFTRMHKNSNKKKYIFFFINVIHTHAPEFKGAPSVESKAVPNSAKKADVHVALEIFLPNRINARNGTNFTFKYNRNALLEAVVVSNPTD